MLNAWILKGPLIPACYIIAGQVDCSQQGKTALRPQEMLRCSRWAVCSRGVSHLLSFVKKTLFFCLFCFAFYMYLCSVHVFLSTKYLLLFCFGVPKKIKVISLVGLIYIWLFFSCLLTLSKTPELS